MHQIIESSPLFRTIYKVWDKLRDEDQVVPTRDRFNPMALGSDLENVVLVERVDRGRYEYRVMGTAVSTRMSSNPVGTNILDYFLPDAQEFLTDWFEAMTFQACGVVTELDMVYKNDPNRSVCIFGLPIRGKGGKGYYYLFGNQARKPKPGEQQLDGVVSAGEYFLECTGIDIGAGLPDLPNMPARP
ncbi:PAS domain-containing protein [Kordiimonas marina]|uniref:PAS domain-containing protein n=1 Tax=Kordiimonas marina TaxID=2872312 RepID=UPI001FF20013|nr:PAS domain-containing protein [Kordiimonas marina]MCJ9428288.1 PAS domain-containing protein [Kordiimonas marina]